MSFWDVVKDVAAPIIPLGEAAINALTPKLPKPVKPPNSYGSEIDYLRNIEMHGNPLRASEDQKAKNAIFAKNPNTPVSSNPGTNIAASVARNDQANKTYANYSLGADQQEHQMQMQAEGQIGQYQAKQSQAEFKYQNLVAKQKAAQKVAKANLWSGLIRGGLDLAATAIGGPGAGAAVNEVTNAVGFGSNKQADTKSAINYSNNMFNHAFGFMQANPHKFPDHQQYSGMHPKDAQDAMLNNGHLDSFMGTANNMINDYYYKNLGTL